MTNDQQIQQVLAALGQDSEIGAKWVNSKCPLARWRHAGGVDHNPSFGVNRESRRCNCFSCGFRGSLFDLVSEVKLQNPTSGVSISAAELALQGLTVPLTLSPFQPKSKLTTFPEKYLENFASVCEVPQAQAYLLSRGLTLEEIQDYGLVCDRYAKRVVWPMRTFDGTLAGLRGRNYALDSRPPKHYSYAWKNQRNEFVFGNEFKVDRNDPVILVEGHFDMVNVSRVYPNVLVCVSAAVSDQKLFRIRDCPRIFTFFDPGKAGEEGRKRVSDYFVSKRITHIVHDGPEDPGELTTEQIEALVLKVL